MAVTSTVKNPDGTTTQTTDQGATVILGADGKPISATDKDGNSFLDKLGAPNAGVTNLVKDTVKEVRNVVQGAPPVDPMSTGAGKTAQAVGQTAIDRSNNFQPAAAPQAGHDPAAQAELDAAKQRLAIVQNPPPGAQPDLPPPGMSQQQYVAQLQAAVNAAQSKVDNSIDPRLLVNPTYAAASPTVTAPTISAPTVGAAAPTQVAQVDPNSLPTVSGGNYSYNPYLIDPSSIPNAVAGSAGGASVSAKMIDPTGLNIDKGAVPDIDISGTVGRKAQLEALDLNRTAALGLAPSAAQILMQQGIDSAVGSAYGLAASTQGRNPGEALRQGVTTAADLTGKSVAQSAALRATEMAEARGQFGTLASQIAAGDIQVAQSNQTKNLQVEITNLNAKIDVLKANQQADLQAGIATASNATAASIATLQAQTQVSIANLNKSVAVDIANQTASNDASKSAAANALAAATTDAVNKVNVISQNLQNAQSANNQTAANQLAVQLEQARESLISAQANQTALLDASKTNATNATNVNIANASNANGAAQFNSNTIRGVQSTNQAAGLSEQQINNVMQLGLSGQAFNAAALGLQTQAQYQAAKAAYDAGFAQFLIAGGKVAAAGATGGASMAVPTGGSGITYGANGSPIIA